MKSVFKKIILTFVAVVAMHGFSIQQAAAQPGAPVSMQTFYDELEPYGQWIDDPELGYVWAPDAGPDFKPYATNGHWAATEYGNTWVSDYDWGWAAFHYGRWRFANDYGWEWIPGTEWGPAWVNWRTGGDYYGWAPLGPGIDIDVSFGSGYYEPDNYWVFAPRRYVYEPNIYRYYLPAGRNYSIIRSSTIINNSYYSNSRRYVFGPRADDVRRYTNAPINIYNINDSRRPGSARIRNNTINIYRPQVAFNNNGNRPEPNRIINRGSYNRNQGFSNGNNADSNNGFNGRNNRGNAQNYPSNNNGFGRNNGSYPNRNQVPQRNFPNQNPNYGRQSSGAINTPTGNDPSASFGGRGNQPNQNQNGNNDPGFRGRNDNPTNQPHQNQNRNNPAGSFGGRGNQPNQNQNPQQNDWRRSSGFDRNRNRDDRAIFQPQNQPQPQSQQRQFPQQQRQPEQRQQPEQRTGQPEMRERNHG